MKLPTTFADPESLSYLYTLLQSSFDQMNDPTNNNTSTTGRKRRRKNEDDDDDDDDGDDDGSSNNNNNNNNKRSKKKKEELKGILTSILLLDEQEKLEQQQNNKVSEEEKFSLETNHKKKTKAMLHYYSNLDEYYSHVEESERVKRKKSRGMARAVAVAVAACEREGEGGGGSAEGGKSGAGGSQRRLWVKDRSGAWWDECNKEDFPEEDFKKAFRMGRETFDMICEELNSAIVKEDTTLRNAIPVRQRVAVCLWRLATGDPLRIVSKRLNGGDRICHR